MNMGKRIKELRLAKGMTLEELGNKVGVGKSTVRKWETGLIENMRRDKIIKVANALDCTVAYLLGMENNGCKTIYSSIEDTDGHILSFKNETLDVFSSVSKMKNDSKQTIDYICADKEFTLLLETITKSGSEQIKQLKKLLAYYSRLTDLGKEEAEKRIEELTYVSKYAKDSSDNDTNLITELNAAHTRTDKPIVDTDIKHDDDIMDDENF